MTRDIQPIECDSAPKAIGPYSQAIRAGDFVYVSGQIPLDPKTQQLVENCLDVQTRRVFDNIRAIAEAAGVGLERCVKLNISMKDLSGFDTVNEVMTSYFSAPFPARACVGVAALPKNALIEVESIFYAR